MRAEQSRAEQSRAEQSRAEQIDVIRVISVLVIFLFHAYIHMNCKYGVLTGFVRQGAIFMVAFFMISGFVLFYANNGKDLADLSRIGEFYRKRLSSTYPVYLVRCILHLVLDQSIQPIQKVIIFPMDIMMLQSTVDGAFGTWHHGGTWFVSCLFFCYLLTPVLVTFIRKLCNKQRVLLISILYVAAAYMPIASHLAGYSTLYSSVIYRCVQFFIGMLLAGIYMENKEKFTSMCTVYIVVALWVTLFGGITLLDSMGGSFQDYDFFAIPLFALLMLTSCYLKENVFGWLARSRIFRYMNSICYEFFMAQSICFKITNKLAAICDWVDNTFCKTITAGMICVGTAVLMHELITKPGQKIMRGVSNK